MKAADLLVALGCLALLVLFGTATRGVIGGVHLRPILLLPFVLYAAARLPLTDASLVVAAVSLSFVGLTVLGRGPYGHESPDVAALLTQEFVFVAGIAALGLSAFLTDLEGRDTETRAVNAELRQKQLALEQSNAELRRIAFVAAHDLQTPLRSICRFSQLLAVECAGKLGPDADDWIRRVTAGTTRLEALLRDLGTLAEIDAGDAPRTPVAMGPLVDEVVRELRGILEETGATIRHTSLPVVEGDVEQLARLLKELCCNAIKHRSASPPEILVSAREEADGWAFAVRDNGRGIPRQEQEKVFDLFYRPGSARDTPGTGLGLALCARIVHRHGGRIWVESQPGEGSTFHFTLRRSESA